MEDWYYQLKFKRSKMTVSKKLVRREKYYDEMCELLLDKHGLAGIAGSLLYELTDIMEREYRQGATEVRAKKRLSYVEGVQQIKKEYHK